MFNLNKFTKEYFKHIFNPLKIKCANCETWLVENECYSLRNSNDVACEECWGDLEARQLDKPEG